MKFTSEDLMKAMGLQVGDKIKYGAIFGVISRDEDNEIMLEIYNQKNEYCGDTPLYELMGREYSILPRPKRVGDLKCSDFKGCDGCPLCSNITPHYGEQTLYEILKEWLDKTNDQEIYDLLKKRLDKEVEDNE